MHLEAICCLIFVVGQSQQEECQSVGISRLSVAELSQQTRGQSVEKMSAKLSLLSVGGLRQREHSVVWVKLSIQSVDRMMEAIVSAKQSLPIVGGLSR